MAKRATLNVSLPTRIRKLIATEVESGRYGSASEVLREGMRLFEEDKARRRDLKEWLRREIAVGTRDVDEGRHRPAEEVFERIRARGAGKLGKTR